MHKLCSNMIFKGVIIPPPPPMSYMKLNILYKILLRGAILKKIQIWDFFP